MPDRTIMSGRELRLAARSGRWTSHTSGAAPGFHQGNLAILPAALAAEFLRFCQANPKPCPLLAVAEPGEWRLPGLGEDVDLRSDLPRYRVWRNGELAEERGDIRALWREDWVGFVLGCSFSFEPALLAAGIPLRHVAAGKNVAMFRTRLETTPAGVFRGPLVVSMRPMTAERARLAAAITARLPLAHGAPVHVGDPAALGIADLSRPDFGEAVDVPPGEIPVFWACGVTAEAALALAKPELCVTHAPGCMLVTDLPCRPAEEAGDVA